MQAAPKISIGVPAYNAAEYLPGALDALLAQTCGDFELIISDNASTDETQQISREYAARDARIVYRRLAENIGAIGNFNRVFELSRGEYFTWAAHDDLRAPTMLQRCLQVLESDSSAVWCHTRSSHIGPQGHMLDNSELSDVTYATRISTALGQSRASARPHQRLAGVLLGRGGCLDSYGLIRSAVIRQTRLYLPYYGSEKVFIAELALRGRYREVPETLFYARVHPTGSGAQVTAADQQQFINPRARGRQFTRLHLLRGYLSAIRRSGLPAAEQARCLAVVVHYLLQVRKWKNVLLSAVRGQGLGGGNVARLEHIAKHGELPTEQRELMEVGR